jgi:hypothetical protein
VIERGAQYTTAESGDRIRLPQPASNAVARDPSRHREKFTENAADFSSCLLKSLPAWRTIATFQSEMFDQISRRSGVCVRGMLLFNRSFDWRGGKQAGNVFGEATPH